MVNTGKPSAGCFTCRKRRVKCDERKPHCFKCEKTGNRCEGYPDSVALLFRDENEVAKKNSEVALQDRPRLRASDGRKGGKTSAKSQKRSPRSGWTVQVSDKCQVSGNAYKHGASSFNDIYSLLGKDQIMLGKLFGVPDINKNCLLMIIRDLHSAAAPCSALIPITRSLAWVNAPVDGNINNNLNVARKSYIEGIAKLRKALQNPTSAPANEMLLVILLVSLIEMVLGDPTTMDVAMLSHLTGASSFIDDGKHAKGPDMFAPIIAVLLNHMMLGCLAIPLGEAAQLKIKLQILRRLLTNASRLPPGAARIVQLGTSAVEIHSEVKLLNSVNWIGTTPHLLSTIRQICSSLLDEISVWSHLWRPKDKNLSGHDGRELFVTGSVWDRSQAPSGVSMWFRKDWAQICLYRILIHIAARRCNERQLALVRIPKLSPKDDAEKHKKLVAEAEEEKQKLKGNDAKTQATIEQVVKDFIDFVPWFLGRSDQDSGQVLPKVSAYATLTPLRAAMTVPGLSAKVRAEVEAVADVIAKHAEISPNFTWSGLGTASLTKFLLFCAEIDVATAAAGFEICL